MAKTKSTKLRDTLFTVIAGIGLLILGLWANAFLHSGSFKPPWWILTVNLLPGSVLIISAFFANKAGRSRMPFVISLIGAVCIPILTFVVSFESSVRNETDPADYEDVLAFHLYPHCTWLAHFPPSIPENATNVGFYWAKGFLQSSVIVQLRLTLPEAEIKALLAESRKQRAPVPEKLREDGDQYLAPPMSLYAGEVEYGLDWPEDFEIIVFHYATRALWSDRTDGTYSYGTSDSYGVAISQSRNEIVYWTEESE